MTNLIGISGKKQSGKDAFYDIVQDFNGSFERKKFADNLKKTCHLITGKPLEWFYDAEYYSNVLEDWNGITIREIQQRLGTEALRNNFDKDVWVKSLFSDFNENSKWINEAEEIKKRNGVLIRIDRALLENSDNHESETSLDNYSNWDYIIHNDETLVDYKVKIIHIMNELGVHKYLSGY